VLPDNVTVDVTPSVAGVNYYTFNVPPSPVTLESLTVVSNSAVQVGGTNNWAAVKTATNAWVYVQAKLSTRDTNAANQIQWSAGEAVPGRPFQRRVTKTSSVETTVTATLGSTNLSLDVWIVWADLTIKVSGTLDPDDKALFLVNDHTEWPTPTIYYDQMGDGSGLGGGNALGSIDCLSNTNLNYAFTVGKMEAKAILRPPGIANLLTTWSMVRTVINITYDNGSLTYNSGNTMPPSPQDDPCAPDASYFNQAQGDMFNLDAPGVQYATVQTSITLPKCMIISTSM
jgi:hypothetical protein